MKKDLRESELYEESYRFRERRSNVRFFLLFTLIVAFFLGLRLYWTNTYGGVQVDGDSMYSTLYDKEQLIVRYTPGGEGIKRGDIVVVHVEDYPEVQQYNQDLPEEEQVKYLIKRLIAVEGDTVKCERGRLYIKYGGKGDFVPVDEPYAQYFTLVGDAYSPSDSVKEKYAFGEYTVGDGEIFFLGDNRNFSKDSRYQQGLSHLPDRLYEAKDVFGVVPQWAIENQRTLEKIFFR